MHVAKEMEREGFSVPLLIGGATTSRTHTAVKIAPAYRQPVIHVQDASRAVGVMGSLLSAETERQFYGRKPQGTGARAGETFLAEGAASACRSRRRGARSPFTIGPRTSRRGPSFLGTRVYNPVPLEEIVPYIDWTPFFHAWELRGIYPKIFEQEGVGPKAKELFDDGQKLLGSHRARKIARSARRDRIFSREQRSGRYRSVRGRIAPSAHDVPHAAAATA